MRALLLLLALLLTPAAAYAQESETRLRVVLVLDASGSMAGNDPKKLVRVASKMLSDLVDERDHVTVMSFGSMVKKLEAASGSEHGKLRSAIETLGRSESCTDYAQALESAAGTFSGASPGNERRVVLFLTDGRFEPVNERGSCIGFDNAQPADRQVIVDRIDKATTRFSDAGARVFTIGLGSAPTRAQHSAAVLRKVAAGTGGQFLHAKGPRDVPRIFANIFGALVGSPVMQESIDRGRQSVTFVVPKGADRLHVVLVPDIPGDLDKVTMMREGTAVSFEPARIETGTSSSYRLARVIDSASGTYTLQGGGAGRVDVLVIPDVGLSLQIEGIPKVVPEGEVVAGHVALRTRAGDKVKLTSEFLSQVVFTVKLGDGKVFDQRPNAVGEAHFKSAGPLKRGKYRVMAKAVHKLGFLDVPNAGFQFAVEPRFPMTVEGDKVTFDTMAEPGGIPLGAPVKVKLAAPKKMPAPIDVTIQLPEKAAKDIVMEPTKATFGPDTPREIELTFRWKDHESLRGRDKRYIGPIVIAPDAFGAKMLVGKKKWEVVLDGKLRAWTWRRYFEEYKWYIFSALGLLLLIIYIVGRTVARRFPPKARIYYVEVGQEFESDSLIKRYAKHGAYRSAKFKFPLGKKARPMVWFKSTGAGFEVIPEGKSAITIVDDTLPEDQRSKAGPFRGSWEQRYRLGDRYEVYLARSAINPDM